jgi:hypothetical protein
MAYDLLAEVTKSMSRLSPPLDILGSTVSGSFGDTSVTLRDLHVLWTIISDRSTLRLEAAPGWDPGTSFDADLLMRLTEIVPTAASARSESVDDMVAQLQQLRESVASAFNQSTWVATKRRIVDLGRHRDAELFGRPYRPPED